MRRRGDCGLGWNFVLITVILGAVRLGSIGSALAVEAVCQDTPPDIIIIVTDDQGMDAIEGRHWSNNLNVHTPNLSTLAQQGIVFTQARVNPTCSPTRAGLLTGRHALHTGVTGVVHSDRLPDDWKVALQGHERTVAEILQQRGYRTLLVDKWHVGPDDEHGQKPLSQGFDRFLPTHDYLHLDDPLETGDEHITRMVNLTVESVEEFRREGEPFALFFWTIDPHSRRDRSGEEDMPWWKVDESLLPSGEDYYSEENDSKRNRYRAVVEALDTELGRLLFEIGVVSRFGEYKPESNTVVFVLSDNGTPQGASKDPLHAKTTLYEGGVRVPFMVFGERVPSGGEANPRLISHVDLFDTIADIVGVPVEDRGPRPRQSLSFADAIGWSDEPLPERQYQLLSRGYADPDKHQVALANHEYKLIAPAGGRGWAQSNEYEFYNLKEDPRELDNLLDQPLNPRDRLQFELMREALVDHWPTAVRSPGPFHVDLPLTHSMSLNSENQLMDPLHVGHLLFDGRPAIESRIWLRFDVSELEEMLPPDTTLEQMIGAQIILAFRSESSDPNETDTGTIRAYPAVADWFNQQRTWETLKDAYRADHVLGMFDPAPHILLRPRYHLCGLPMPVGTPVSFGHTGSLLDTVRSWNEYPARNRGVVVMADLNRHLIGDQSVTFMHQAVLRLTFDTR